MTKRRGKSRKTTIREYGERKFEKHPGNCGRGKCTGELACKELENNFYSCVCPHDSKAPMPDGSCPRFTVPLKPGLIPNVLPPSNIPHGGGEKNNSSRLKESPPSVQHSIAQQTLLNAQINYYMIGGSVCLFLSTIFVFSLILKRKCWSNRRHESISSPVNLKNNILLSKRYAPNPQYTACSGTGVLLIRKDSLQFFNDIGEGCFGKVYRGEYKPEGGSKIETVAIKVLKENASKEAEDDFLREVEIMSAFRHPNILSLLGVVPKDDTSNPMMVFEFMYHGDLAELLRAQRIETDKDLPILSKMDLLHIALQIARGMSYLASQRFVHRDLACRNCLVSQGPTVKIADFGMSRDVYTCDYYKVKLGGSRLLPVRWMSPESVIYGRFTLESDIWSYGVVLWEIYSFGKQPYYGHTNEEVIKLILDGIMLIPPTDSPSFICELMKNCWKTEARDRIKFVNICDKLEVAYDNFQDTGEEKSNNFEFREKFSRKTLPRPPPIPMLMDSEGYLLAREIEPVHYLETLPG